MQSDGVVPTGGGMPNQALFEDVLQEVAKRTSAGVRRHPASTYRVQFGPSFTFRDATAIVPYLHDLGITHVYASPYLKARPGSTHGYDITDHNALNPELGTFDDYREFVARLREYGMGHIMDFVPNHMSTMDNPWWFDVLENGQSSPYAGFFDVYWQAIKPELRDKVLLPVLGDHYGRSLAQGKIGIQYEGGALFVVYAQTRFPVDPKTIGLVLNMCLEKMRSHAPGGEGPGFVELQSIATACGNLPGRDETNGDRVAERRREKEVIRRRIEDLLARDPECRSSFDETLVAFNGRPGDASSFDLLHALLESQVYRLCYWQVASDEINYRRFFDINQLIALRMESPSLFSLSHSLVKRLVREDMIDGLRIDHIDGLFDPASYLGQLQRLCFVQMCCRDAVARLGQGVDIDQMEQEFSRILGDAPERATESKPMTIIVEKILLNDETLRESWPVDGTTGYDFGAQVGALLVDRKNVPKLLRLYHRFISNDVDPKEQACDSKALIMATALGADLNVLAYSLASISEASRSFRDLTLNSLRDTIREVIACFPVYRTYIDPYREILDSRDKASILLAVARARKRNPAMSSILFNYLRDTLLMEYPQDVDDRARERQRLFIMHFQQLTGPVMAKGSEDTAFYRYNVLTSANEVGSDQKNLAITTREFHQRNRHRASTTPLTLNCTYTHDSKRSEDVRARIAALSEIPTDWKQAVTRWAGMNRRLKTGVEGARIPDRNTEYLFYQTLIGTFPVEAGSSDLAGLAERVQTYMLKAVREAKVHTSWISPDGSYEEGLARFVAGTLEPRSDFLRDFSQFADRITDKGLYNALAQVVLRMFSPGIPDTYQGSETWDFSLVDPDNRRQVDYQSLARRLASIKDGVKDMASADFSRGLLSNIRDGRVKTYILWRSLEHRREFARQLERSSYRSIEALGALKEHVCSFYRRNDQYSLLVVVPRLFASLLKGGSGAPIGGAWGDTALQANGKVADGLYRDIFTSMEVNFNGDRATGTPLSHVLGSFPFAALVRSWH